MAFGDVTVNSGEGLTDAVAKATDAVQAVTTQAVQDAVDKTAKEVISLTRGRAPKRTGVYAKSWRSRKTAGLQVGTYGRVVYAGKKPGLTHLLENGHEIGGAAFFRKNKARTAPFPHIATDDETEKIFTDNLVREIEKDMGTV